uniref:Odorant receptor n=1 Tax=Phlebotomus papatasi TaxID=29031 RepID=A0A3F2ZEA7_PHLPP
MPLLWKKSQRSTEGALFTCYSNYQQFQRKIYLLIQILTCNVSHSNPNAIYSLSRRFLVTVLFGLLVMSNGLNVLLKLDIEDLWFKAAGLLFFIGTLQVVYKMFAISRSAEEIRDLLEWIGDLHTNPSWAHLKNFVETRFRESLLYVKRIIILSLIVTPQGMSLNMFLSDTLIYPMPGLPRDQQFIWQIFAVFIVTISVIVVDSVFMTMGFFIVGILNIFLDTIAKLNSKEFVRSSKCNLQDYYQKHLEIMVKLRDFDELFSALLVIQLLTSCPLIVAGFFMIRLYPQMIACYLVYAVCIGQYMLICIFGEFVHSKTEQIFRDLYLTKWYKMSIKDQMVLLMMMKMAIKPFSLKAAGMYEINMKAFVEATKLAFSLCALLFAFD